MVFFCSTERTVTIPRSPNGFGFKNVEEVLGVCAKVCNEKIDCT